MVKRTGILMLAVAAVGLTLVSANDARAFFGRRGGSEGSSGGCWGSTGSFGSSGGSSGSFGSHGGRFFRHRHSDSGGSCGESDSCGCGETASSTEGNDQPQQASDRDVRGERHEAGYNSETRIRANQPMPAPERGERRGDNDRQARDRGNESRETSPRLNSNTKHDSDKPESASDRSSNPKQQE
jgi:hypothetical protein